MPDNKKSHDLNVNTGKPELGRPTLSVNPPKSKEEAEPKKDDPRADRGTDEAR